MIAGSPILSVCIPTRNGAEWIAETIASATSQDADLEVVVSDDASSDATVEIAASAGDARVRVERSASRLGMAENWNRAIALSGGSYVKVLMQDDALLPGALAIQQSLLERHPAVGFAFGPRVLEGDGTPAAEAWMTKYGAPHEALQIGGEVLSGREVVSALTRRRLRANAIGEPSVVLIRRTLLDRVGLFDVGLRQLTDLDLWIRLAAVSDVAFDPRPVARFRVHAGSATARNRRTGAAWLDRLRIIDGLHDRPETRGLVGASHYAVAVGAGSLEMVNGLLRRRRSVAAAWSDVRAFRQDRSRTSGTGA